MNSSYFNSNLLQETLNQKDTIASLNIELDRKNDQIRSLELSNREKEVVLERFVLMFRLRSQISDVHNQQIHMEQQVFLPWSQQHYVLEFNLLNLNYKKRIIRLLHFRSRIPSPLLYIRLLPLM